MQVRNTKRDRARRALRRRGVIMIETMVGIAVISTTVLTGLLALSTASIAGQQVSEGSTAGWITVSQVELIRTLDYVSTGGSYESIETPEGFTVTNTTSAYPGGNSDIQVVTVTVSRDGRVIQEKEIVKVNR